MRRWNFKIRCPNPACPAYDPAMTGTRVSGFAVRRPAPGPEPVRDDRQAPEPSPVRATVTRQAGGAGISWVLWLLAYVLFRIGQHEGGSRAVFYGLAAAIALTAFMFGRRAAPPARPADEDDAVRELRELEARELADSEDRDPREPFDPTGDRRLEIRYRNWQDEEEAVVADRTTLRRRGDHVTVRVEPDGGRIALPVDRILNRADVEGAIPA